MLSSTGCCRLCVPVFHFFIAYTIRIRYVYGGLIPVHPTSVGYLLQVSYILIMHSKLKHVTRRCSYRVQVTGCRMVLL